MGTSVLDETRAMPVEVLANLRHIPVGNDTIEVGPLVLRQQLALGRLIGGLFAKLDIQQIGALRDAVNTALVQRSPKAKGPAQVPAGTKRSGPTPSNGHTPAVAPDWSALLMLLDDETWGQAASIVTRRPSEWCLDNLTLSAVGLVVEAVLDLNDTEVLRRLFTRAASPPSPSTPSSDRDN
jgi:hypothetical protein